MSVVVKYRVQKRNKRGQFTPSYVYKTRRIQLRDSHGRFTSRVRFV